MGNTNFSTLQVQPVNRKTTSGENPAINYYFVEVALPTLDSQPVFTIDSFTPKSGDSPAVLSVSYTGEPTNTGNTNYIFSFNKQYSFNNGSEIDLSNAKITFKGKTGEEKTGTVIISKKHSLDLPNIDENPSNFEVVRTSVYQFSGSEGYFVVPMILVDEDSFTNWLTTESSSGSVQNFSLTKRNPSSTSGGYVAATSIVNVPDKTTYTSVKIKNPNNNKEYTGTIDYSKIITV